MARGRSLLAVFVRASALHVGAAATTAALREELSRDGRLTADEVDTAYAVSRLTPGTNLLAIYAQLAHQLGGWRLAAQAVAVGAIVPAAIALAITALYILGSVTSHALMTGARAGGLAILLGSAVRLLKPRIVAAPLRTSALAALTAAIAWTGALNAFALLLLGGVAGALMLRRP
jgi:chromate transport protein ChrA